ncbi:MAG TPA: hypothetical protein VG796_12960 [Verrucomicrobiales bacterium]|nr:hypothetical protein [Verrucomicrobiales bacterium]
MPALPRVRGWLTGRDGTLTVEEYHPPGLLPLAEFLTKSAAPLWIFVSIVQQCLTGLSRLHECGLLHGAILPETLVVETGGNVVLVNAGGGICPPEWKNPGTAAAAGRPLSHALAIADLQGLGRVFRTVLGGDADVKMTVSRPDIAPMVAEWIDWLSAPEAGREPRNAAHAESVFGDIRAGRAGLRPWQDKLELPPEVEFGASSQPRALTDDERRQLRKAAARAHGSGMELRNQILIALLILGLTGGGILASHYLYPKNATDPGAGEPSTKIPDPRAGYSLRLSDEPGDPFAASGGDVEPLPDTAELISQLTGMVSKDLKPAKPWEEQLLLRSNEQGSAGEAAALGHAPGDFLYDTRIFPALGKTSQGLGPGDYYLVWRTAGMVMTPQETCALQSALLRCARYCGVRVLAWTVLPNHAATVLRVLPRRPLPDEKLERRIAILRGEKTAAGVIDQVNAKLKAGDEEGAELVRRKWTASMGSAAGFFSVIKTVPVVDAVALQGRSLWQDKPLHLSLLDPDTPEVLQAAAIVDTAALRGQLVEKTASAWPLCGLRAAMHNYGPALRAISVLMQRNPQASLPVPVKDELLESLDEYRRYLGDLAPDPEPSEAKPEGKPAPQPATSANGKPGVHAPAQEPSKPQESGQ